jgi:hypothetical protein
MRILTLICTLLLLLPPAALMNAQGPYNGARSLIDRVAEDLRHASRANHAKGKERERIENAQHHLSDFDRSLSRGKFDKDRLDEAIEDLKNVADHNTLTPEDRDALNADLRDLRQLREQRGQL